MSAAAKFSEFMNKLTIAEHGRIVNEITEKCMVSRNVVYTWKGKRAGIKPIYWGIIENIAKHRIFVN